MSGGPFAAEGWPSHSANLRAASRPQESKTVITLVKKPVFSSSRAYLTARFPVKHNLALGLTHLITRGGRFL